MPAWFWEILFIIVLILFNGFFAAAEIAIVAARKSRLQQRAEQGDRGAQIALELATDPNRFLPTVQVGITLVSTFAAAFAGDRQGQGPLLLVVKIAGQHDVSLGEVEPQLHGGPL